METEWYVRYNEDAKLPGFELIDMDKRVLEFRVTGNGIIAELLDRGISREDATEMVVKAAHDAGIPV